MLTHAVGHRTLADKNRGPLAPNSAGCAATGGSIGPATATASARSSLADRTATALPSAPRLGASASRSAST